MKRPAPGEKLANAQRTGLINIPANVTQRPSLFKGDRFCVLPERGGARGAAATAPAPGRREARRGHSEADQQDQPGRIVSDLCLFLFFFVVFFFVFQIRIMRSFAVRDDGACRIDRERPETRTNVNKH